MVWTMINNVNIHAVEKETLLSLNLDCVTQDSTCFVSHFFFPLSLSLSLRDLPVAEDLMPYDF